jgi:hypothetical protein
MENREQMKATDERIKANGEQMKAGNEELRASIKAASEQIGKLGNRFGETIETKVKPSAADINEHMERMEKLRRYADSRNGKRKYLGAVAGAVFGESEKTYALKKLLTEQQNYKFTLRLSRLLPGFAPGVFSR